MDPHKLDCDPELYTRRDGLILLREGMNTSKKTNYGRLNPQISGVAPVVRTSNRRVVLFIPERMS